MGQAANKISAGIREPRLREQLSLHIRCQRSELLRQLRQRARLRHDVATLFCRRGMESVRGWFVDVLSRVRIHLGLALSVGLDAVSLRKLDLRYGFRMGLAAWRICRRMASGGSGDQCS